MRPHAQTYDWAKFRGSAEALKYACRDLATLDQAVKYTPGRRAAVQAGGNLGIFAHHLARTFATVYTFEPSPKLFPLLMANAPEANIIRFQAALGETRGELVAMAQVRRCPSKGTAHEGITHIAGPGVIPTIRLDDLALPICDLLVLDLEGWELYALRGAAETIRRCKPTLLVEINQNVEFYGLTRDSVRDLILGHGYRCVTRIYSDELFVPLEAEAAA